MKLILVLAILAANPHAHGTHKPTPTPTPAPHTLRVYFNGATGGESIDVSINGTPLGSCALAAAPCLYTVVTGAPVTFLAHDGTSTRFDGFGMGEFSVACNGNPCTDVMPGSDGSAQGTYVALLGARGK